MWCVRCSGTWSMRCCQLMLTRRVGPSGTKQDPEPHAQRNGYRHRPPLDTRVGTIDVAIPKPRSGTYFPHCLLQRRKRSETALITVVADCATWGAYTRRMDKLVKTLGISSLSKSHVSPMAADLNEHLNQFRHRPFDDAGPFHVRRRKRA